MRSPITSGKSFPNQGPRAKTKVSASSLSPGSSITSTSRPPKLRPGVARPMRIIPPMASNSSARVSQTRRARTTPASYS